MENKKRRGSMLKNNTVALQKKGIVISKERKVGESSDVFGGRTFRRWRDGAESISARETGRCLLQTEGSRAAWRPVSSDRSNGMRAFFHDALSCMPPF